MIFKSKQIDLRSLFCFARDIESSIFCFPSPARMRFLSLPSVYFKGLLLLPQLKVTNTGSTPLRILTLWGQPDPLPLTASVVEGGAGSGQLATRLDGEVALASVCYRRGSPMNANPAEFHALLPGGAPTRAGTPNITPSS